MRSMWGLVKLSVMKLPIVLQALSSIQAYSNAPKGICTDRLIGTWKAMNTMLRGLVAQCVLSGKTESHWQTMTYQI